MSPILAHRRFDKHMVSIVGGRLRNRDNKTHLQYITHRVPPDFFLDKITPLERLAYLPWICRLLVNIQGEVCEVLSELIAIASFTTLLYSYPCKVSLLHESATAMNLIRPNQIETTFNC